MHELKIKLCILWMTKNRKLQVVSEKQSQIHQRWTNISNYWAMWQFIHVGIWVASCLGHPTEWWRDVYYLLRFLIRWEFCGNCFPPVVGCYRWPASQVVVSNHDKLSLGKWTLNFPVLQDPNANIIQLRIQLLNPTCICVLLSNSHTGNAV